MAPLGAEGQRKQQQRHRDKKAQRLVERDGGGGDGDDPRRVRQIAPRHGRDRRALVRAQDEQQTEQDEQSGDELGHHARAGKRQRAKRQVAAERKHEHAEGDKDAAGDVVATQSHGLSVPLPLISSPASPTRLGIVDRMRGGGAEGALRNREVIGLDYPSTLPMERMAASMRLLSASQNAANSGWSIYASSWPRLASAALNCSPCAALFSSSRR